MAIDIEQALADARKNPKYAAIARQSELSETLPDYIFAVAGASVSEDLYKFLEDRVQEAGTVRGRSKSATVTEEDEEVIDTETEYTRPNGETYYSRKWSGHKDVKVLQIARKAGSFPFLYGPPGTGKTALAEAAFGQELITIVISGDTQVDDLVGQFLPNVNYGQPNEPQYIWSDGPLTVAVKEGRPVLFDEIGLADAKVLSVIYPLMDGRRELFVTTNAQIGRLPAKEGFFVIGATNPNAPGVRMSEALLSRFLLHVEVTTDWALAGRLGVPSRVVTVAENLSKKMSEGSISWAPQFRELLAYQQAEKLFGAEFALANMLATCPEVDRALVIEIVNRAVGRTVMPATI